MRNRTWLGIFVLLCALGLVTPAGAITVNGVDYVLFAQQQILMENGPVNITGNVGVSDVGGNLLIGAHNTIAGSATADKITFGSFSLTDICRFNTFTLANPSTVCSTIVTPLPAGTLPLFTPWPPGPLGAVPVDACVNTAANFTSPIGGNVTLAPGCYKDVRVSSNSTVTLTAGTYTFRSFRMIAGSTLNGAGQTINAQQGAITEPNVEINDVTIETPAVSGEPISIGNNSRVNNTVLYAPLARIHLHTGGVYTNFEGVAKFITVEPIIITGQKEGCGCFEDVVKSGTQLLISKGQSLSKATGFFLSTTCNVAGATPVNTLGPVTDTNVTLDVSGKTCAAPGCHVIAQFNKGTWCSGDLIVLP